MRGRHLVRWEGEINPIMSEAVGSLSTGFRAAAFSRTFTGGAATAGEANLPQFSSYDELPLIEPAALWK